MLRLAQVWQDFHQARLSVARLGDILNTAAEPSLLRGSRRRCRAIRGNIRFEHVVVPLPLDGPEILHDVSLRCIRPARLVGIVGSSGSGKSTFAKLVQRLYVPQGGRVLIDGMDLAMVDPAWLRRQIGVVLQENMLFNRSVRDNIALADPAMPMERDHRGGEACRRARLHPGAARGLRYRRRRARHRRFGRAAPAHRDRARTGDQSPHPDLRRGDQRARLRKRADHPGQHEGDREGPHRLHHRPPVCPPFATPTASSRSSAAASSKTAAMTH